MTSLELEIGYHRLDTKFFSGHVRHTTFHSDISRGRRRVAVETDWYRGRELGRGSFGTVFLEKSENGEYRAVKDIAKDKNSRIVIDYKRELMAMARLGKDDALFVQLLGWYESDDYVHIAMEYISHGHLRNYMEVERSESEAKAIASQLLEGLLVIHQEDFAHRDLKPENIFVVSTSPIWVKIGDFGLAKLKRDGTAFRTEGGTRDYVAPEVGIDISRETSEYTNAIDIWALGCITYEVLTQTLPFRGWAELSSYCSCPKLPKDTMLAKNISKSGIEFVERVLAYPPECRITAREALDLKWLQPEEKAVAGMETEKDWADSMLPERPDSPGGEVASGDSLPENVELGFYSRGAAAMDVKGQRAAVEGLSVLALGRNMGTLDFRLVFDRYEEKLLEDHEALSKEIATGLVANLRVPSPSWQTPLAEKEVLFPAYLINIVTCEMFNSGFVKESEWFLVKAMGSIRGVTRWWTGGGYVVNAGAFWLSNVHEILSFAPFAQGLYEIQIKDLSEFARVLKTVKHDLERLEFDLYDKWMAALKRKLRGMIVPAIFGSQYLPRFVIKDGNRSLARFLPASSAPKSSVIDNLLGLLSEIHQALQGYFIEKSITTQAVTELLKFVGVTAFNDLLQRKNFLSWERGIQIDHTIKRIEGWCESHDMPEGALQLGHLMTIRLLLWKEKETLTDIEITQDICSMLSPYQILKLLAEYKAADWEQCVSIEVLKAIALRGKAKSNTLLLQAVGMDGGPYEIPEPRAINTLEAYVPPNLRTDRLMQIVNIVSRRAQARAKAKQLATSGVESEGT